LSEQEEGNERTNPNNVDQVSEQVLAEQAGTIFQNNADK
jgi:hypothetical protein